jgi:uncharacterized membrane protein
MTFQKFTIKNTSLFLIVGMICVWAYSVLLPIFIAPDDLYHFDCIGYLSNTVVDRRYISTGTYDYPETVRRSIKNHKYLQNFFLTRVDTTNRENVMDVRAKSQNGFQFWGHVIPALGMRIGYYIYPSVGVMVIFSRLFAGVIYLLCLYFLICRLRYGKRLFMAVSLTPTMLPLIASMGYDGLSYVASVFFLKMVIHLSVEKKCSKLDGLYIVGSTILLILFAKTNALLFLLFLPALLGKFFISKAFLEKVSIQWQKNKRVAGWLLVLSGFILSVLLAAMTREVWLKFFDTLVYPNTVTLTSEVLGGNLMFAPSLLLSHYWLVVIVLLLVSSESKIWLKNKLFSYTSVLLYFVNLFGVLFSFRNFANSSGFVIRVINGQQGRYFTPFILPFAMVGISLRKHLKIADWIKKSLLFGGALISAVLIIYAAYMYGSTRDGWY